MPFSMFSLAFRKPFASQTITRQEVLSPAFAQPSSNKRPRRKLCGAKLPHFKKKKKLSSGLNVAAAKNQKCFTKERQQQGNFSEGDGNLLRKGVKVCRQGLGRIPDKSWGKGREVQFGQKEDR
jgi:hypothetical protein